MKDIKKQENNCIKNTISKGISRRTNNDIRKRIIESLENFPKSTFSLAKDCKLDWRVADRHLHSLEELGKLRSVEHNKATYWVIRK